MITPTETKLVLLRPRETVANSLVNSTRTIPAFATRSIAPAATRSLEIAMSYRPGSPIPTAPYTELEHGVWKTIWQALGPAHREHACAEYLDCLDRLALTPIAFRSWMKSAAKWRHQRLPARAGRRSR